MRKTLSFKVGVEKPKCLQLLSECSGIFNAHVRWGLDNGTYNKNKAHHALYAQMRVAHPNVPAAIVQSVRDTAMEALRACKLKREPKKRPTSGVRLDRRTFRIRGDIVTFSCIGKRQSSKIHVPEPFKAVFGSWKVKGANLVYRQAEGQFYVNVCFEATDPPPAEGGVLGVDRGIYYLAVASDGRFFSGNQIRASQRRYLRNRRTIQAKGTRSARRRRAAMAGRERRFSRDVNHRISKALAATPGVAVIAMENLKGIRKRTRNPNDKRNAKGNKWLNSWPFWQLEEFTAYKAAAIGKRVEFVDPRFTSQRCSKCGAVDSRNRNKSRYRCTRCGHTDHADLNAAVNIRNLFILSRAAKAAAGAGPGQRPNDVLSG